MSDTANAPQHELVLTRTLGASPAALFRCWTEPDLVVQWFTPAPWKTLKAEMDPRPGGKSFVVMADPDGNEYPNLGVFLEIVPNEKIVSTDAYTPGWVPAEKPFFTAVITFEDLGDGTTRYTARALHWRAEDAKAHEEMGFHEGWGQCADQLEALAKTL